MEENRYNIVLEIFNLLDQDHTQLLSIKNIIPYYDVNTHPSIRDGKLTQDQALDQLIAHFRYTEKPGYITMNEFLDYYLLLSAMNENDDDFERLVRGNWKI